MHLINLNKIWILLFFFYDGSLYASARCLKVNAFDLSSRLWLWLVKFYNFLRIARLYNHSSWTNSNNLNWMTQTQYAIKKKFVLNFITFLSIHLDILPGSDNNKIIFLSRGNIIATTTRCLINSLNQYNFMLPFRH